MKKKTLTQTRIFMSVHAPVLNLAEFVVICVVCHLFISILL